MRTFGLIGYPLAHSFSKKYFAEKFSREKINDAAYENFKLNKIEDFPTLLKENSGINGLNVTVPYKEAVMKYLDEIDSEAQKIGAVNTIKITAAKTKGFNTDHIGFIRSLIPVLQSDHQKALVLGTGGSSRAVKYTLERLGKKYLLVSRKSGDDQITYDDLNEEILKEHKLIINTTPVGMYPQVNNAPDLPYDFLTPDHLLIDLIYNPEKTLFLKKGEEKGAAIKNGYEMLLFQAEESWKIWNDF